jgi:hypothetical protein
MSGLDDRKSAFENKFALDEANLFKAEARGCKLFGLWLSEKIGLEGEEANSYAADIIGANLEEPGFNDVLRFISPDVKKHNLDMSDEEILLKIEEFYAIAQEQIKNETD